MRRDQVSTVVFLGLAVALIVAIECLEAFGEPITVLWLIREDGLYESLGALASIAAGVTFFYLAFGHEARASSPLSNDSRRRWWYVALGLGLLAMFVEEISWGQRVFGFSTPDWLESENRQQEFNLHNLFLFNPQYDFNWLKLAWVVGSTVYLGLFALAEAASSHVRRMLTRLGLPVASWPIGAVLLAACGWYLHYTEQAKVWGNHLAGHAVGETFEVVIEVLFLALAVECLQRDIAKRSGWRKVMAATMLPALLAVGIGHYRGEPLGEEIEAAAELQQGITLFARGRLEEAQRHFERSIEILPENPEAEFRCGIASHSLNDLDAAIVHFKAALTYDPAMIDARYNLALVYLTANNYAAAETDLQKVVAVRPDDAEAHYYLAIALIQLGNNDSAVEHLREALRLRPHYAPARRELKTLEASRG